TQSRTLGEQETGGAMSETARDKALDGRAGAAMGRARTYPLRSLLALLLAASLLGAGSASASRGGRSITVMTQNLYQGTEFAHIAALAGKQPSSPEAPLPTT